MGSMPNPAEKCSGNFSARRHTIVGRGDFSPAEIYAGMSGPKIGSGKRGHYERGLFTL